MTGDLGSGETSFRIHRGLLGDITAQNPEKWCLTTTQNPEKMVPYHYPKSREMSTQTHLPPRTSSLWHAKPKMRFAALSSWLLSQDDKQSYLMGHGYFDLAHYRSRTWLLVLRIATQGPAAKLEIKNQKPPLALTAMTANDERASRRDMRLLILIRSCHRSAGLIVYHRCLPFDLETESERK
ncbi:hypothetical protein B0H34DRAFT_677987 [Crassisporium funariophilum]|nr:hypothetical protein B0H34DRAFT_677987 [Crassisporium funariophilum]